MARKVSPVKEEKKGAPAYIVSMSALWTIMLSFFILMCTMAQEQEAGFVAAGTGSFIGEMSSWGLEGLLRGTRNAILYGFNRPVYNVNKEDVHKKTPLTLIPERQIKAPDRRIENLEPLPERKIILRKPTDIRFAPGSYALDQRARRQLDDVLGVLRGTVLEITIEAYLDQDASFNSPASDILDGWELSTRRAQAVAEYLHVHGQIPRRRLVPVGYSSHRPVSQMRTERTIEANDRLVIVIYDN